MKKRITALIMLLIFCLSSCTQTEETYTSYGKPSNPAIISVEYPNKKVNKNDAFEVKIGIGQANDYPKAEFWIATGKLTIMLSDGTEVGEERIRNDGKIIEVYEVEYSNFDGEEYDCGYDRETHRDYPTYIQTFKLLYNGTEDEYVDGITIGLRIIPAEGQGFNNVNDGTPIPNSINLHYKVKNGKIEIGRLPFD
jgi:hypothetical protein